MLDEIIAIHAITDDLLKALGHHEDSRIGMNDAEVITERISSSEILWWESRASW